MGLCEYETVISAIPVNELSVEAGKSVEVLDTARAGTDRGLRRR